ncbi:uncharacterized protein LOC127261972 [Andrographis paniculata]|uniref:uncharacterized protein LOC127261972 n=1 Tax=Andrographis paniculata TaxID=175694 RepID=UPI0021E88277|nr:uncharacterized protein LOC127261972 [Andrographis paniculata]
MDVHYQSLLDHTLITSSVPRGSGHYEVKPVLVRLASQSQFHGLLNESPYEHLQNFNRIAATSKSHGITEDAAKLILFPFSLSGEARKWFDNLYPIPGSFKEATQAFIRITPELRMSLDTAAGSSLMGRCASEARALIEKMTANQSRKQALHKAGECEERAFEDQQGPQVAECSTEEAQNPAEVYYMAGRNAPQFQQFQKGQAQGPARPRPQQQFQRPQQFAAQQSHQGGYYPHQQQYFQAPHFPQQAPTFAQPPTAGQAPLSLEELWRNTERANQEFQRNTSASIKMLEIQVGQIAEAMKLKQKGTLPGTVENIPNQAKAIETRGGKRTQSPPLPDRGIKHSPNPIVANVPVQDEVIQIPTEEEGSSQPRAIPAAWVPEPKEKGPAQPLARAPFPTRLGKKDNSKEFDKFVHTFRSIQITIPFADALSQMSHYAKFIKDIIDRKRAFPDEAAAVQLETLRQPQEENFDFINELNEITTFESFITLENLEGISNNGSLELEAAEDSTEASGDTPALTESIERATREPASDTNIKDELKKLPEHLKYIFLGPEESYPLIISALLLPDQKA